jgi:hypothetical protein
MARTCGLSQTRRRMSAVLRDIVLEYIDAALDIDDLENISDYTQSIITGYIADKQLGSFVLKLHADLQKVLHTETDHARKHKIKAALSYLEADFSAYIMVGDLQLSDN